MKILGICGSPKKKDSTTLYALKKALEGAQSKGANTALLNLADYTFSGCIDCNYCREELNCSINDDFTNKIIPVLNDPEIRGFIYASPVYFGTMTAQMKAFQDRSILYRRNGYKFENMVAGVLTVGKSRNGGQELAAMDLIKNCLIHAMTVVSDRPPTSHFGAMLWSGKEGGIKNDKIGIETAINLGEKIAEIVIKLNHSGK